MFHIDCILRKVCVVAVRSMLKRFARKGTVIAVFGTEVVQKHFRCSHGSIVRTLLGVCALKGEMMIPWRGAVERGDHVAEWIHCTRFGRPAIICHPVSTCKIFRRSPQFVVTKVIMLVQLHFLLLWKCLISNIIAYRLRGQDCTTARNLWKGHLVVEISSAM